MLDLNWQRISRWTLLGAIVMVLWLLAPTVKCSFGAFKDEPLSEATPAYDRGDKPEEPGFFERWGTQTKACYKQTPLLGQEAWKNNVLYALAGLSLLTYLIGTFERSRKRTYDRGR